MPTQASVAVENSFVKGFITEASGLNFPENACTETFDCIFNTDGTVSRRQGIDFEQNFTTKTIDRASVAISTFLWKNVSGDGNVNLYVAQIGGTLYFWETTQASVSLGALSTTIDLADFLASGAPSPDALECQFASGNKYLIVTHPYCQPFRISYDSGTQTATGVEIILKVRDFEGDTTDAAGISTRPSILTVAHNYNLGNQGWGFSSYPVQTSSTNMTPAIGSKVFTVTAGGPWAAGQAIYIWAKSSKQGTVANFHFMEGTVTSYVGTTLTTSITGFGPTSGASSQTDWQIASGPDQMNIFQQVTSFYPSNADQWWVFKNAADEFDPRSTLSNVPTSTTPAPKGHYILTLWDQDRDAASGLTGVTSKDSSYQRPSTSAFFAGRIFYAGVNFPGFNSEIYFTQILERDEQYGFCYQTEDPTSPDLFDLLPTDGGVLKIPEAGTIYKLFSTTAGLLIFANNGVWLATGSTGIGFAANDYTIQKISSIPAISASSFVDVAGFPAWWNSDGIYVMAPASVGATSPQIKSLSLANIKTYYDTIPNVSKTQAKGCYQNAHGIIQWLFRTTESTDPTTIYEYDRILNYNVFTNAFYLWTIPTESIAKINSLVVFDVGHGQITTDNVIDSALANVVDGSGNQVTVFEITGSGTTTEFMYFVSYPDAGSYKFTFAEAMDPSYQDWSSLNAVDYESYFISGYKIRGQAIRKSQPVWVNLYSNTEDTSTYLFQGVWDYAISPDSNRYTTIATQTHTDTNYKYGTKRVKLRGHGKALQFKISSVSGEPFELIGWSVLDSVNQLP